MEILILSVLILINGFFALSEIGLVSCKRTRLEQRRQDGSKGARIALELLDDSETFLSAIQVGITLIGIVTGVYGGMNIADDMVPLFQNIDFLNPYAYEIALVVTVLIITYVSIVIGELVPKTIALSNPDKVAIAVAPIIYYFSIAFYPFVKLLSYSTSLVNRVIGVKKPSESMTEAELKQMIKIASNEGVIEKSQNFIHEKIFYFADKRAKHIMTHRTDVEWIDLENPLESLKEMLLKCHHNKIICCKGNLDNLVGIIFLNGFYKSLVQNKAFNIEDIISEPSIVHESTDAQNVLELMRKDKTHICCVVNEFGGFEGIITLRDIIEHIVGHIPDEDEPDELDEPDLFVREDKSVLVSGDAPIEVLGEVIQNFVVDFEKIDYSTVAGFVLNQIGNIPRLGDKFDYMGYSIEIVDLDGIRVDKILIAKIVMA